MSISFYFAVLAENYLTIIFLESLSTFGTNFLPDQVKITGD
jgi:hypothetical protein